MGNKCTTCNTCGKYDTVEFLLGNFYLEDYQNYSIPTSSLSRHDKWYRVVCNPLPQISATDFFEGLDELDAKLDLDHEAKSKLKKLAGKDTYWKNQKHFADNLPIEKFIDHFKTKKAW